MEKFILLIPALIVYIAIFAVYWKQAMPQKGIWFGVTLPTQALKDARLKQLQAEYQKSYTIYGVISFLCILPLLWLGSYFSLAIIYLFLWIAGSLYTSTVPFKRIHHKVAKLKRDNNWFVSQKQSFPIDGKVTRYMQMVTLSAYWFSIPLVMAVLLIIFSFRADDVLLRFTGLASLFMTIVIFTLYMVFSRMKPRAYSSNPDVNAAINHAGRRYWSMLWVAMAVFEAINAIIAYYVISTGTSVSASLWMSGIFVVSLVPLIAIYYVHNKIKDLEYWLSDTDGRTITNDSDHYWIHGMFYSNPDDPSVMVPKRVGVGSTVNRATPAGKLIYYGSFVLTAVIIISVTFLIAKADSSAPELKIDENRMVTIHDSSYPYSFHMDDIQEITLEDKVPTGFRSNGIATAAYARGNFKLTDLGKAKLYVFKKAPPYIVIKLEDLYIVYNDQDPAKTEALYEELSKPN